MSRNDQVIRQWMLLKRLESTRGATLEELRSFLPEDYTCHVRTIRRDLEALEARFPIITESVEGRIRWRLMEGFARVPALSLSPTELMALIFGADLLKPLEGTPIKSSLDSALAKAATALPAEGLDYVRQLKGHFSIGLGPHKSYRDHKEAVARLLRAVADSRTVQMRYYSASRGRTTRRSVDPYKLHYVAGALYLIGYCHLRRDVRMFAVDRIRAITLTNRPCQMPLGFDLDAYMRNALVAMRGEEIEVTLRFDRRTSAWVRDRRWHPSQRDKMGRDGCLTMELRVADTPELLGWILGFGSGVRVIHPNSLRIKVHSEARKIFVPSKGG